MENIDKKALYKSATEKLLAQIHTFGLSEEDTKKAVYFTKLFREAFKYDEIKKYVFVSRERDIWDLGYDSAGFCRVASITFSVVMGVQDWELMCISEDDWSAHASHHYLKHRPSGKFFDITYDQFAVDGYDEIPYDSGHTAFIGLHPKDMTFKFANALDIDIYKLLKNKSNGK